MNTLHIKKDDQVIVISGDDKGKRGKVLEVSPKEGRVIVEGAGLVSKHVKPRRQGEAGGIVKVEGAIVASKVALYCSKCGKGVRANTNLLDDGTKERVCAKCGAPL